MRVVVVLALVGCRISTEGPETFVGAAASDDVVVDPGPADSQPTDIDSGAGGVVYDGSRTHSVQLGLGISPSVPFACSTVDAAGIGSTGFPTVQAALDAAVGGDVVEICPGIHRGGFVLRTVTSADITIRSASGDPSDTILHGAGVERVLKLGSHTAVVLADLTFERGWHDSEGGGVHGADVHRLEIDGCVFRDNASGYQAGAVSVWDDGGPGTPIVIRGSTFEGNVADYEAGALEVGIRRDPLQALVEGCTFRNNHAGYEGGAITSAPASGLLAIRDTLFEENTSGYEGGAVSLGGWSWFEVGIEDSTFVGNASPRGGGVQFHSWATGNVWVTDSVATGNTGGAYSFDQAHGDDDPDIGTVAFSGGVIQGNDHGIALGSDWFATLVDIDIGDGVDCGQVTASQVAGVCD